MVTHLADNHADSKVEKSNAEMDALIRQYDDVFASELPEGVPPDRNAFETIPLEANSQPPFKHMYRLNPQERERK